MSRKTRKVMALMLTGGILLQLGGCVGSAIQLLVQQLLSGFLSSLLAQLIGTANNNTTM